MVEVTVTVTDVDELGALSGPGSFNQAEGGTDAMETYTLSGGDGTSTVSWMLDGADASHFMLDGTGMSRDAHVRERPRLRDAARPSDE